MFIGKLLGLFLVIGSFGFIGQAISQNYLARPRQLKELEALLGVLETEVSYSRTPLPKAFERIGGMGAEPCSAIFREARRLLLSGDGYTAREAWELSFERVYPRTALSYEDRGVILGFGQSLGASGKDDQVRIISETREHLRLLASRAQEEASRNARIWSYLGLGAGLILALVLY